MILSSEHFSSRLRKDDNIKKLKSLLSHISSDIEIIAYIRPQVEVAISLYSTYLRKKGTQSLEEFICKNCKPSNYYYNYWEMLNLWDRHFDSLNVNLFAVSSFKHGNILPDILDMIGLDIEGFALPERTNEAISQAGMMMYRSLNILESENRTDIRTKKLKEMRNKISNGSILSGGSYYINLNISKVQDLFEPINSKMFDKYLPDKEFKINYSKYKADLSENKNICDIIECFLTI